MSVKATPVDAVAGFVKPGDRVDIMYVERMGTGKTRSAILLRKMLVLAVNTTNTLDEKTGAAIQQVESATLAVNDRQGHLLALADEKGKLKLLLTTAGAGDNTPDNEGRARSSGWTTRSTRSRPRWSAAPKTDVPAPPKMDRRWWPASRSR